MEGTVEGFRYGLATPVAAFLLACLGGLLGPTAVRPGAWPGAARGPRLVLGATTLGCGVWAAHVVALTGFGIAETPVGRDALVTAGSLAVAVATAGVGLLVAGHRGPSTLSLITGGTVIGLGIATTHYLGMTGLRVPGSLGYATSVVALSVVVAVAAATLALRAATSARRPRAAAAAAALGTGTAVTGMHYTGLAAVTVTLPADATAPLATAPAAAPAVIAALLAGPVLFLLVAAVVAVRRRVPAADAGQDSPRSGGRRHPGPRRRPAPAGHRPSGACAADREHACRVAAWPAEPLPPRAPSRRRSAAPHR
ncbi:MHYT domain-containing protein [Streptomyces sp. ODS05-4]|uniref:MHYT domain-containing protein n=1 Tax=Streptomyces sp. ODS05-4 TaxID=2944939 RepID=UPI002109CD71|nr:MHYT domain-containing protein [Streptomyces sp. ODS05-4]